MCSAHRARLAAAFTAALAAIFFFSAPAISVSPKAALVLEHAQPSAWNNLLRSGLARGGKDFGMETEIIIAPPGANQRDIFRKACSEADLVIVASDNLHEALRDNAANFRQVKFGCVDAGIRAPNIMSVTFADEQAAFLAGAAAAMLARDQKKSGMGGQSTVAWLSGMDTPAMRSLFNGFSEGAALAVPQTRVIQALAGSFTDPAAAENKAAWLLNSGAAVIALAAGQGNSAALRKALESGACPISLDEEAPKGMAIVKAADRAVYEIMESAAGNKFRGKEIVVYNLANKGVDFTGAERLASEMGASPDIARRVRELRGELEQGSIRLRSLRARTLCDCLD